jgi:hypothetical protein
MKNTHPLLGVLAIASIAWWLTKKSTGTPTAGQGGMVNCPGAPGCPGSLYNCPGGPGCPGSAGNTNNDSAGYWITDALGNLVYVLPGLITAT